MGWQYRMLLAALLLVAAAAQGGQCAEKDETFLRLARQIGVSQWLEEPMCGMVTSCPNMRLYWQSVMTPVGTNNDSAPSCSVLKPALEPSTEPGASVEVEDTDIEDIEYTHNSQSFDFASASAGAKVLMTSDNIQGAPNLLVSDPDKYLMVPCVETNKWVVIQLSEDIGISGIGMNNLEHYSSGFGTIQVLGSEKFPTKKWVFLGNFTAQDVRSPRQQFFTVGDQSLVRYVKIRFLSHYGSHHFCTVTSFSVFGSRGLEILEQNIADLERGDESGQNGGDSEAPAAGAELPDPVQLDGDSVIIPPPPPNEEPEEPKPKTGKSVFERLTGRIASMEKAQRDTVLKVDKRMSEAIHEMQEWVTAANEFMKEQQNAVGGVVDQLLVTMNRSALAMEGGMDAVDLAQHNLMLLEQQVKTLELVIVLLCIGFLLLFLMSIVFFLVALSFRFDYTKSSLKPHVVASDEIEINQTTMMQFMKRKPSHSRENKSL